MWPFENHLELCPNPYYLFVPFFDKQSCCNSFFPPHMTLSRERILFQSQFQRKQSIKFHDCLCSIKEKNPGGGGWGEREGKKILTLQQWQKDFLICFCLCLFCAFVQNGSDIGNIHLLLLSVKLIESLCNQIHLRMRLRVKMTHSRYDV